MIPDAYVGTILVVTGVITVLPIAGLIMPSFSPGLLFGASPTDDAGRLLGRHWSLLIGLVGGLLIYAGFHAEIRVPVMIVAAAEKLVLAGLVFTGPFRKRGATLAVVGADSVMALIYLVVLTSG